MATDPLKQDLNRANQIKTDSQYQKGIRLYDVDLAIAEHMIDTVVPTLEVQEGQIEIPVLYGNPERWKAIQKDGFLRDSQGQLQIPMIMFKRNSIDRTDAITSPVNRSLTYPAVSKYSPKHKYDLFSQMNKVTRPLEQYNITVPDYVTITYEVMVWTDFINHMNTILEAFQYATDTYWGDKQGFKFKTQIDSFDNTTEISDNTQRIVRSNFTMVVHAYLLPESFNNEPTTKKAFTVKRVVWEDEKIIGE